MQNDGNDKFEWWQQCAVAANAGSRRVLLATAAVLLVEPRRTTTSGRGVDGSLANYLSLLLVRLRKERVAAGPAAAPALQRASNLGRLAAGTASHGLVLAS